MSRSRATDAITGESGSDSLRDSATGRTISPARAGEDGVFAVHISHQPTARMVRNALEGAAQRLERPRCQGLFDRYVDAEGQPLRASLPVPSECTSATGHEAYASQWTPRQARAPIRARR